jgi:hypothetical protein
VQFGAAQQDFGRGSSAVERRTHKAKVVGSTPTSGIRRHKWTRSVAWLTRLLVEQKIVGSNPIGSANGNLKCLKSFLTILF